MYFERVIKLLFATTAISIFSYLLFFVAIGQAGNGGEYWGFSGIEEPGNAATRAYESGDQRMLKVRLSTPYGEKVDTVPTGAYCDGVLFGNDLPSRPSIDKLIHGPDSVQRATEFAHRYNSIMAVHVASNLKPPCDVGLIRLGGFVDIRLGKDWLGYLVLAFYLALVLAVYLLWPGRRHYKDRLTHVQSKIREIEDIETERERVAEDLDNERKARRILPRIRRRFSRRK